MSIRLAMFYILIRRVAGAVQAPPEERARWESMWTLSPNCLIQMRQQPAC